MIYFPPHTPVRPGKNPKLVNVGPSFISESRVVIFSPFWSYNLKKSSVQTENGTFQPNYFPIWKSERN